MKAKLSDKAMQRIAKKLEAQVPTLEELDETFEQDEAHQEFMRSEEEMYTEEHKVLDQVEEVVRKLRAIYSEGYDEGYSAREVGQLLTTLQNAAESLWDL